MFYVNINIAIITLIFLCIHRIDYHLENESMPIFEKKGRYSEYTTSRLVDIITDNDYVNPDRVCKRVQSNVS